MKFTLNFYIAYKVKKEPNLACLEIHKDLQETSFNVSNDTIKRSLSCTLLYS